MTMRNWSERRRRAWRWGVGALIALAFLCPVGQTSTCSDADGGGTCTTNYVPLMGSVLGYSIPAP